MLTFSCQKWPNLPLFNEHSVFLHFWIFILSGERYWNKSMLPQPGLEPRTSLTGLSLITWTKMKSVLMVALWYGAYQSYHTGPIILRQNMVQGSSPPSASNFLFYRKPCHECISTSARYKWGMRIYIYRASILHCFFFYWRFYRPRAGLQVNFSQNNNCLRQTCNCL